MIKKTLFPLFFFFGFLTSNSQIVSGKIINKSTLEAIQNAAIVTNLQTGTISNNLGDYSLDLKNVNTITFSCLGFQSKTFTKNQLYSLNYTIYLIENINELEEIKLNIAKISLDSLLIKTVKSMNDNYISSPIKQEFYAIENQKMDFKKLELELKSSSLLSRKNRKHAEQEFENFSKNIQKRKPEFSSEFKATVFSNHLITKKEKKQIDVYKVEEVQGFKKADIGNGITVKNVTKKLQNIILKHLSTKNTYKVKSGLFKIEDSLSFAKVTKTNDSILKDNSFRNFNVSDFARDAKKIGAFYKKSSEINFLNRQYYNHKLEKNEILGNANYYVISFNPRKSKSKYSGTIYINPSDFSIKKINYQYADGKRGDHINLKFLLGVKFSENEHKVTLFYEKNEAQKIYPSYFHETKTSYAYINRPLKFIENSGDKNKMKFNIKVEINVTEGMEVLLKKPFYIDENLTKPQDKEDLKKRTAYMTKEEYENSDWKNSTFIKKYLEKYQ